MSKFRSDSTSNQLKTMSLLLEASREGDESPPIYTLAKEDRLDKNGNLCISLYKAYMAEDDLSEYSFASKYFESWEHWQRMKANQTYAPAYREWAIELEHRTKSKMLARIKEIAENGSLDANKFLATVKFTNGLPDTLKNVPANALGRGRPSNATPTAQTEADMTKQAKEDLKRLGVALQ